MRKVLMAGPLGGIVLKAARCGSSVLVLILWGHAASAQWARVGIELGMCSSKWHQSSSLLGDRDYDSRTDYAGGGFLSVGPGEAIRFRPGLLFAMKGATDRFSVTSAEGEPMGHIDVTYAVDYIEFPLLVEVAVPFLGRVSAHGEVGVVPAIRVSARQKYEADFGPAVGDYDLDWIRESDLGFCLGGGLSAPTGGHQVAVQVRYTRGLRNIAESDEPGTEIYNRSIAVLVAVSWTPASLTGD